MCSLIPRAYLHSYCLAKIRTNCERKGQEAQILQQSAPRGQGIGRRVGNGLLMGTATISGAQKEDEEESIDEQDIFDRVVFFLAAINLLSAPLMIPLVCCHINSFRRASSCGEAMARRRKEERWAGIASRGI
jgi:hypothetical protein